MPEWRVRIYTRFRQAGSVIVVANDEEDAVNEAQELNAKGSETIHWNEPSPEDDCEYVVEKCDA